MFFIISSIILGANTVTSMFSSILSHRAKCAGILQVLCHEISKWKKINFIYKLKQYKRHRYLNGKALCIHYLIFLLIECLRLYVKKYSIYFCMLQLYSILPLS